MTVAGWSAACPAKVNLFLRILAREDGGHHQIETLFQAVGLCDRVDAIHGSPGIDLEVRPPAPRDVIGDLGDPGDNTVMKSARAFHAATGIDPAVSLVLTKSIPAGTGLGGASSDAAGTLLALNALHDAPLSAGGLIELGGRIGADVPFFCSGAATALAWGRGDRLVSVPPPPRAPVVLAVPAQRVSTAAAYREASSGLRLPAPPSLVARASMTAEGGLGAWDSLAELQGNDFERTVFAKVAGLASVRSALEAEGATIARLTGSGSVVFGVFADDRRARAAAAAVEGMKGVAGVLVAPTLTEAPALRPLAAGAAGDRHP